MTKRIMYPILILESESCPAEAKKRGWVRWNFRGKNPLSAALTGRGGGSPRNTPNYQLVSICSNHLLLDTPDVVCINMSNCTKNVQNIHSHRSGSEGKWPDLEKHCENRISEVYPKSKLLRVSTKLVEPGSLDEETRTNVNQDITVILSCLGKTWLLSR